MRAQILKAFGGPENFEFAGIPKPEIRPGTVLVHQPSAGRATRFVAG